MKDLAKARLAASQVLPEIVAVEYLESRETGEKVFGVDLPGRRRGATVTLNPNGLAACVEWRSKKTGPGYRIFRLRGKIASALS